MVNNIAKIVVNSVNYALDKPYSYRIPIELIDDIKIGMRVLVPFGIGNSKREGIVLSLSFETDTSKLKPVAQILDKEPVLDDKMIKLILNMRKKTFCTFFSGAKAALPAGLWFNRKTEYKCLDFDRLVFFAKANLLYSALIPMFENRKKVSESEIKKTFSDGAKLLKKLCADKILGAETRIINNASDQKIKILSLALSYEDALQKASNGRNPVRIDVVECLRNVKSMSIKELSYMTGASEGIINTMTRQGILLEGYERIYRASWEVSDFSNEEIELNAEQQEVYEKISMLTDEKKADCAVLFGVTGSGKTHIYMKLIDKAIRQNRSAILLVPEISLTPQMIQRFSKVFGDTVAVLHSALSLGEKYDQWQRIKNGYARLVIGTRSAIFAPLPDLGIIIIDEEQDGAYRSETTPRYDAREIAKYRAMQNDALLLLGSATPSVENYYNAQNGKYHYFELAERFGSRSLPSVTIADMRGVIREGNGECFSPVLIDEIWKNINNNEQTILFLNRRGSNRHVKCVSCGYTPMCEKCSVAMTYHSVNDRVMCHYCGYSEKVPVVCPECISRHLEHSEPGTQKIEQEIYGIFGDVSVLRMDADTTSAKNSHEKILKSFADGQAQILIGTQMVTKGLDFENVTLVGVLNADLALYSNDYKSNEKTFSIITQVIGRAGRHEKKGRAVIQTYSPDHPVILSSAKQNYTEFYENEIDRRGALMYPPFNDIVVFTLTSEKEQSVMKSAMKLKNRMDGLLKGQFKEMMAVALGPTPATIAKLHNKFRYHVSLRCEDSSDRQKFISGVITEFQNDKTNSGVTIIVEINPDNI